VPDLPEIRLGEVFRIDGQPGEFKTERLVADADALVIQREKLFRRASAMGNQTRDDASIRFSLRFAKSGRRRNSWKLAESTRPSASSFATISRTAHML
jgi:hypothetical protein